MIRFRIAEQKDDSALRSMMRKTQMPGWITLSSLREPDFFAGRRVQGKKCVTFIAENNHGELIATGTRCERRIYLNGVPREVGYLCGLRSDPKGIPHKTVFRGYAELKKIHDEKKDIPFYLTTIVGENKRAKKILDSRYGSLPVYQPFGKYITSAIPLNRFFPKKHDTNKVRHLCGNDLPALIEFLNSTGRKKQFFPVLEEKDFSPNSFMNLKAESFYAIFEGKKIIAVAGLWDQSCFKQHVVCGYRKDIAIIRPVFNLLLGIAGFRKLPSTGEYLKELYIAFPCVKDNRTDLFRHILSKMLYDLRNSSFHFLCGGFQEKDPLLSELLRFRGFHYESTIYLVYWEDGKQVIDTLEGERIPHLELGSL